MKQLIAQIIKFGGVGALCFFIETGLLALLKNVMNTIGINEEISVMLSKTIAFCVAVTVNYYLSILFVFEVNKDEKTKRNFVVFVILSVIGLVINLIIMYVGTIIVGCNYMIIHILATAVVMVYNFITRKVILEKE